MLVFVPSYYQGGLYSTSGKLLRGAGAAAVPSGEGRLTAKVAMAGKGGRVPVLQRNFVPGAATCRGAGLCPGILASATRESSRLPTGHGFIPGKQTSIFPLGRGIGSSRFLSRPPAAAKGLLEAAGLSPCFWAARCEAALLDYRFRSLVARRATSRGSGLRQGV